MVKFFSLSSSMSDSKINPWISLLAIAFAFLFGAFFLLETKNQNPVNRSLDVVEKEFFLMGTPPHTKIIGSIEKISKFNLTGISGNYLSSLSDEEIKEFYNKRLLGNGWIFLKEQELSGLSKSIFVFCKGEHEAYVERSNQPWMTYSFGIRSNGFITKNSCKKYS